MPPLQLTTSIPEIDDARLRPALRGRTPRRTQPTARICVHPGCGQRFKTADPRVHRCLSHQVDHQQRDDDRRHAKQHDHGRDTARWVNLRRQALLRDGHTCQLRIDAACTGTATTVHLDPALEGNHAAASLDDVASACAHCHGAEDATRSRGGSRADEPGDRPVVRQFFAGGSMRPQDEGEAWVA